MPKNGGNECSGGIFRAALLGVALGVQGLLIAIPILGIVNVICQHAEELQPLAEMHRD